MSARVFPIEGFTTMAERGLTKRELIASLAMLVEIRHIPDLGIPGPVSRADAVARNAVAYADALIRALEPKEGA